MTQEGKSSAVWLGLSWNPVLLGGTGDRCSMTATSRTSGLMRMMAAEDPGEQGDSYLLSWKGDIVG